MGYINLANVDVGKTIQVIEATGTTAQLFDYIVLRHGYKTVNGVPQTLVVRKDTRGQLNWASGTGSDTYKDSEADKWCKSFAVGTVTSGDNLPSWVRNRIPEVTIPIRDRDGSLFDSGTLTSINRKVFLLSEGEVFGTATDGPVLPYFNGNVVTTATATARRKANNRYWLRTPDTQLQLLVRNAHTVETDASFGSRSQASLGAGNANMRPAFCLPANLTIFEDQKNQVINNQSPGIAGAITVERNHPNLAVGEVLAGKAFSLSWGAATDVDNDAVRYILEWSTSTNNGTSWGAWTKVVNDPIASTSYSAATILNNASPKITRVRFRVRATDNTCESLDVRESNIIVVVNNAPPEKPGSIALTPQPLEKGGPVKATCGAATDTDGNFAGYVWEQSTDGGGTWTQIADGINNAWNGTLGSTWLSIRYRVKAYDTFGAESAYETSAIYNLRDPVQITVSQAASSGIKGGVVYEDDDARTLAFTVTTNKSLNCTVRLTHTFAGVNTIIESTAVTINGSYTFARPFTKTQWQQLLNGAHTFVLSVSDGEGNSTQASISFEKAITVAIIESDPIPVDISDDGIIKKFLMTVLGTLRLAEGAELEVEVTNNALDGADNVKWERVYPHQLDGSYQDISNAVVLNKEDGMNWFAFRITARRGTSGAACWIDQISGVIGLSQSFILGQENGKLREDFDEKALKLLGEVPNKASLPTSPDVRLPGGIWKTIDTGKHWAWADGAWREVFPETGITTISDYNAIGTVKTPLAYCTNAAPPATIPLNTAALNFSPSINLQFAWEPQLGGFDANEIYNSMTQCYLEFRAQGVEKLRVNVAPLDGEHLMLGIWDFNTLYLYCEVAEEDSYDMFMEPVPGAPQGWSRVAGLGLFSSPVEYIPLSSAAELPRFYALEEAEVFGPLNAAAFAGFVLQEVPGTAYPAGLFSASAEGWRFAWPAQQFVKTVASLGRAINTTTMLSVDVLNGAAWAQGTTVVHDPSGTLGVITTPYSREAASVDVLTIANSTNIVQTIGDSQTAVMSQKAVSSQLRRFAYGIEKSIGYVSTYNSGIVWGGYPLHVLVIEPGTTKVDVVLMDTEDTDNYASQFRVYMAAFGSAVPFTMKYMSNKQIRWASPGGAPATVGLKPIEITVCDGRASYVEYQ